MISFLNKVFQKIIELLFPKDEAARLIEEISAAELLEKADNRENFDGSGIESILSYRHPLARRLIWLLKYEKDEKAVKLCAELALERIIAISEEKLPSDVLPILLPIPLGPSRLRERGYNQVLLIAEGMFKMGGEKFFELQPDVLIKIKDTPSQTKIENRVQRLKNLENCFAIKNSEIIQGREIIVLDDVTTTGATFSEASKTLENSGAKNIHCIAIAH